ncbi:hypothetical protein M378DRAFT_815152 [Amanita muscaria Koide BX008]|uniref:Uncharacterized protein n=1 Tax=Amanita muscaria (strain Koide BX008) TaxID=946122 RepID=A0A0C2WZD6_AMAMK|nr:hypothetical protein M378DRAFT_815152 [Amanita muscaria Koide BX008]
MRNKLPFLSQPLGDITNNKPSSSAQSTIPSICPVAATSVSGFLPRRASYSTATCLSKLHPGASILAPKPESTTTKAEIAEMKGA